MLCTSPDKVYRTISKQKSKQKGWEIKCLICLFRLFQPKRGRRCRKETPKKGKAPPVTHCRNTGLLFHFLPRNVLQKREFNVHEWTNCPGDQINECSIKKYTEQNDQFCFWLLPVLESEPDHNLHSCRWSSSSFSSGTLTEIPQLLVWTLPDKHSLALPSLSLSPGSLHREGQLSATHTQLPWEWSPSFRFPRVFPAKVPSPNQHDSRSCFSAAGFISILALHTISVLTPPEFQNHFDPLLYNVPLEHLNI